ncbi:hypothetical protein FRC12_015610, partial [Ceratobasidium sp. 428]
MASFRDRISMISPWVDPGNFYKFIDRFPEADRMDLVTSYNISPRSKHAKTQLTPSAYKWPMVWHTYMQTTLSPESAKVCHLLEIFGDMKAQNILIGSDGIAMLTDFGLSILGQSKVLFSTTKNLGGGSTRWMAPELIGGTTGRSREADVYALGM